MTPAAAQRTLRHPETVAGIGLHTGVQATARLLPAPAGTGVVFRRADLPGTPAVPSTLDQVVDTERGVALGREVQVRTVEHLLSAARGLGIDNLFVDVDSEELPCGDGSAMLFVDAFLRAGIVGQEGSQQALRLDGREWVASDSGVIMAEPSDAFSVFYIATANGSDMPPQAAEFQAAADDFARTIAPARTFGHVDDLPALRARGLALGASEANTVGYGRHGFLNELRFPNELARHKILDAIGDLALLGRPLLARVVAFRAGHDLHVKLAHRIAARLGLRVGEDQRA